MPSGLKQVYAMFNGQKVLASYSEETGLYTVETTAPANSSWSQPNHVYPMTLHAEDMAGNVTEVTSEDPTYGSQLQFRVLEKSKPVAEITAPAENSVFGSGDISAALKLTDVGDSGINFSSVVFKLDGTAQDISSVSWATDAGVSTASVPLTSLADGVHKIALTVSDNDGNASDEVVRNFVISTAAPTLDVTSPADGLITNYNKVTVAGAAAAPAYTTLATVSVNGTAVDVGDDGSFSTEVTLTEGSNTITVVVTDSIGKATSVTRTVYLDTAAPVISDIVAEAVTVDASGKIKVTFRVTDA